MLYLINKFETILPIIKKHIMESPKPGKTEDIENYHTTNEEDEEISYEEQQLQLVIMKELETQKINAEREFVKKQDEEYQQSLKIDTESEHIKEETEQFEEVSIEEMRKVRLARFCSS